MKDILSFKASVAAFFRHLLGSKPKKKKVPHLRRNPQYHGPMLPGLKWVK